MLLLIVLSCHAIVFVIGLLLCLMRFICCGLGYDLAVGVVFMVVGLWFRCCYVFVGVCSFGFGWIAVVLFCLFIWGLWCVCEVVLPWVGFGYCCDLICWGLTDWLLACCLFVVLVVV